MSKQLTVNKLKRVQLEDIRDRKAEILDELSLQKDVIIYSAKRVLNPFAGTETAVVGTTKVVRKFNTGIALFDGLLMGYKMIQGIKKLFRRRR